MNYHWKKLSGFSKEEFYNTRIMIHQAIQLPAITGRCLNNEDPDDKTASLTWLEDKNLFAGQFWIENNHRAALSVSNLQLLILDKNDKTVSEFNLNNKTFDESLNWLAEQVSVLNYDGKKLSKNQPYKIPHYKYADSFPFQKTRDDLLIKFETHYANANLILNKIKSKNNSSDVLCWPHHFDIATTIMVGENSDPEKSKSISLGMSPGDSSYNQPYYYVSPWPYPAYKSNFPNLLAGKWHTENWFGAVLTSDEIVKQTESDDQFKLTTEFINSAINAARNLL